MPEKYLHIVCLDVPYPVDYGGVFDLFYKIKALHKAGIRIHLHCFEYGRGEQPELNKYCETVRYYKRQEGHKGFSTRLPYIVSSRINEELNKDLLADTYPILLEGIHCTFPVLDERFANRKIIVRLHNTEYLYYKQLAKSSNNLFRKAYYWHESYLLKKYEKLIAEKATLLAVSEMDQKHYREEFGAKKIGYLPVFLPFETIESKTGIGCFCLYHGNLGVAENEKAAIWLLEKVFNDVKIPLVIAGKNPSSHLEKLAHQQNHTCLVSNPSWEEMQDMIGKAQINLLPSFNNTGIKLKLLNVLFNGKHCVVNDATIEGTGLEAACHTGTTAAAFKSLLVQLYNQPFAEEEVKLRKNLLETAYRADSNAASLITWLY